MRITFFYQYFGTPKGKWSTRVYELTRRWVEAGHKVTVITAPYEKSDLKVSKFITRTTVDGINLIIINAADSNKFSTLKRIIRAFLFAFISAWYGIITKADILIASSGPITIGMPALIASFFKRVPFVFEVRDLWPEGGVQLKKITNKRLIKVGYWFEKLLYRKAAFVVASSRGMKEYIQAKVPDKKILVIPNASDIHLFNSMDTVNPLPDKNYVVYTGSLGLIDDAFQLVYGAEELQKRGRTDIMIMVFGGGVDEPALTEYVNKHNLTTIKFNGLVAKKELVAWLKHSKASLLTVKNTSFLQTCSPNKLFDAFAAGVPVIQTTTGWIYDLIEAEKAGINIVVNDAASMADAIEKLVDDEVLGKQMAINSYRLAETLFNRDKLAAIYLDELKKVYEK